MSPYDINAAEREGERTYPIWRIGARWICDGSHKDASDWMIEGLPEGRRHSSTNFLVMFDTEERGEDLAIAKANKWWETRQDRRADNSSSLSLKFDFQRRETWCLEHFNHWTFDKGQSDQEILRSFERFVFRMMPLISADETTYCLMGADNLSAWSAGKDDARTDPPCRCRHCKKSGRIVIDH